MFLRLGGHAVRNFCHFSDTGLEPAEWRGFEILKYGTWRRGYPRWAPLHAGLQCKAPPYGGVSSSVGGWRGIKFTPEGCKTHLTLRPQVPHQNTAGSSATPDVDPEQPQDSLMLCIARHGLSLAFMSRGLPLPTGYHPKAALSKAEHTVEQAGS